MEISLTGQVAQGPGRPTLRKPWISIHLLIGTAAFDLIVAADPEPIAASIAYQKIGHAVVEDGCIVESVDADSCHAVFVAVSRRPFVENCLEGCIVLVVGCRAGDQNVIARVAVEFVVAVATDEDVAAEAGDKFIVSIAADEDVVTDA